MRDCVDVLALRQTLSFRFDLLPKLLSGPDETASLHADCHHVHTCRSFLEQSPISSHVSHSSLQLYKALRHCKAVMKRRAWMLQHTSSRLFSMRLADLADHKPGPRAEGSSSSMPQEEKRLCRAPPSSAARSSQRSKSREAVHPCHVNPPMYVWHSACERVKLGPDRLKQPGRRANPPQRPPSRRQAEASQARTP